jgi:hypothetical protein
MAMSTSLMASVHSMGILHCRGNRILELTCRYEPIPAPVVQKVPTCVVEEPEDWMGEYPDTLSQPFQLREFRIVRLPAESYLATEGWSATPSNGADMLDC